MAVDFVSSGHGVDGDYRDKRSVPEFVQPLLVEKTEAMKKEDSIVSKEEEEEESESDEEIATPLASKRIVPLSSMDEAAASNRSTLSHSFNTECISYYKKRL